MSKDPTPDRPPLHLAHAGDTALLRLREGNVRFAQGRAEHSRQDEHRRQQMEQVQNPFAVVLTCVDSRIAPEMVFDQGMGDMLVARVPGNIVDDSVLASVEFAVNTVLVPLVVVMGHSNCSALQLAIAELTGIPLPVPGVEQNHHFGSVIGRLVPSVNRAIAMDGDPLFDAVHLNIANSLEALTAESTSLACALETDRVRFVGCYFDIATGIVEWL